ncbi:anti-sigma factor family protein [Xanthomonas sontii]|uniref:anti-sigma factor family protein n=1 Tax=Xanthomonas sontii TaxID=2650745 RepID=UPI003889D0DB
MNTTIDALTLQAYADGELDAAQAAQVEAALRSDPQLAQALERLRSLQARLRAGFAPVLDEAVPARLLAAARARPTGAPDQDTAVAARPASPVHATAQASRPTPLRPRARRRWALPAALAAALLLGLWIAQRQLPQGDAHGPTVAATQGSVAEGALAQALTQQLSGQSQGSVRIGLSFRDRDGHYCRTFAMPRASAGLACQRDGAWRVELLVPAGENNDGGGMRMAASPMPAAVLQAVDARIAGEALDADGEQRARARGWR